MATEDEVLGAKLIAALRKLAEGKLQRIHLLRDQHGDWQASALATSNSANVALRIDIADALLEVSGAVPTLEMNSLRGGNPLRRHTLALPSPVQCAEFEQDLLDLLG